MPVGVRREMGVWVCDVTANGKIVPIREIPYCFECMNRSVNGLCIVNGICKPDDGFCSEGVALGKALRQSEETWRK